MTTLQSAVDVFLQVDRAQSTNEFYSRSLAQLTAALGPETCLQAITLADLIGYIAQVRQRPAKGKGGKPLADVTVRDFGMHARIFFNWCVDAGYIDRSPAKGLKIRVRRNPDFARAIPPEEAAAMVAAAKKNSKRDFALLLFLADTGCRVGGLLSLTLDNLYLVRREALLIEKGEKPHRVFFGEKTADALHSWLISRPKNVDYRDVWISNKHPHKPITRQAVEAVLRALAKQVGASRMWGPHSFRHALGHAWALRGVPITITQEKLGHSDPSITMKYYYPQGGEHVRATSDKYSLAALESVESGLA